MNFVSRRPLFTAAMIFLITGVLSYYIDLRLRAFLIIALSAALVVIAAIYTVGIIRHRRYGFLKLLFVLIFPAVFSFCLSYAYFGIYVGNAEKYIGKSAHIEALVTETTFKSDYSMISSVKITSVDGQKTRINAVLYTDFECDVNEYDTISLDVVFSKLSDDEYGFSEKKYNLSKGRIISVEAMEDNAAVSKLDDTGDDIGIFQALRSFSKKCSARLSVMLGDNDGGFVSALLLGNKEGLEASLKRDFRRLGLSHMLAISGMHLSVLSYALEKLIISLGASKRLRCFIMIPAIIAFAGVTGFSMSVLRASLMLIIYYLGFFLSGERDSLTSLAVSCAIICIAMPNAVLDCGLQLSFSATLGLIVSGKLMPKRFQSDSWLCRVARQLISTVSAVLFTLPFMWIYFGEVSIISPLTNLIFCIPVTLVLYISPFLLLFSGLGAFSSALSYITSLLVRIIRYSAAMIARLPALTISLTYDFTAYALLAAAISLFLLLLLKNRKKKSISFLVVPIVVFSAIFSICLTFYYVKDIGTAYLGVVNYSGNDTIVIKNKGDIAICDMSDGSYRALRIAAQLANSELHAYDIDAYMLTHYHQRHISSFRRLAESYYVKTVFIPEPMNDTEIGISAAIMAVADDNGCKVVYYDSSLSNEVQLCNMTVYTQKREYIKRSTHPLISVRFGFDELDVTYVGSAGFEAKENRDFLRSSLSSSDILIAGAHGPLTKSSIDAYRYMLPQYVISSNSEIRSILDIECDLVLDFENGEYVKLFKLYG